MHIRPIPDLGPRDAVVAVDVQRDFCPGGALPVPDGQAVVPALNEWIAAAQAGGATVVVSRDWHPPDHVSFKDHGGRWPHHCVQETQGAALHPDLRTPEDAHLVTKGDHEGFDQYSAFDRTGLGDWLKTRGVERVWIGGLAQELSVGATALDALGRGFEVHLVLDATRPRDAEEGRRVLVQLEQAGVRVEPPTTAPPPGAGTRERAGPMSGGPA